MKLIRLALSILLVAACCGALAIVGFIGAYFNSGLVALLWFVFGPLSLTLVTAAFWTAAAGVVWALLTRGE